MKYIYKIYILFFILLLTTKTEFVYACIKADDASRITVAGGSITEIIYMLGQEERLVAVDITSNFPNEAKELPSIGYVRALSAEGILSISPTLILGENDMGPPAVIEQLKRVGVQIKIIPEENTSNGIINKVECIAEILGVDQKIKKKIFKNLADDANTLKDLASNNKDIKVMFILGMESGSPTVGGGGTSANGLISMTGGVNVMSSFEGWKPVSTEAIIEAKPDFILITERGLSSFKTIENLGKHPSLALTPASKNNNIIVMDGMAMLGFGPRTIKSAKDIAEEFARINE